MEISRKKAIVLSHLYHGAIYDLIMSAQKLGNRVGKSRDYIFQRNRLSFWCGLYLYLVAKIQCYCVNIWYRVKFLWKEKHFLTVFLKDLGEGSAFGVKWRGAMIRQNTSYFKTIIIKQTKSHWKKTHLYQIRRFTKNRYEILKFAE